MRSATLCLLLGAWPAMAAERTPVLIDTDIGADIDDAFALALAVASPELEVVGITTVGRGDALDPYVRHIGKDRDEDRALARLPVPHAGGGQGRSPSPPAPTRSRSRRSTGRSSTAATRPPIYNRTLKPVKESAVELLGASSPRSSDGELDDRRASGPLTNVGPLPPGPARGGAEGSSGSCVMGGSVAVGYDGKPKPEPEWNIKTDIPAAKAVFASGMPLTVVPLDATATVKLEKDRRDTTVRRPHAAHVPGAEPVRAVGQGDADRSSTRSPCAAAFDERFFTFKDMRLEVDDNGMTVAKERQGERPRGHGGRRPTSSLTWYVERVRAARQGGAPEPPKNPSQLVEPGGVPGPRPRLRGLRDRHREALVDVRQAGDEGRAARQGGAGLPGGADAGLRRPAGQTRDDVPGGRSSTRCPARRWARTRASASSTSSPAPTRSACSSTA